MPKTQHHGKIVHDRGFDAKEAGSRQNSYDTGQGKGC
jgi:hypothetical protein